MWELANGAAAGRGRGAPLQPGRAKRRAARTRTADNANRGGRVRAKARMPRHGRAAGDRVYIQRARRSDRVSGRLRAVTLAQPTGRSSLFGNSQLLKTEDAVDHGRQPQRRRAEGPRCSQHMREGRDRGRRCSPRAFVVRGVHFARGRERTDQTPSRVVEPRARTRRVRATNRHRRPNPDVNVDAENFVPFEPTRVPWLEPSTTCSSEEVYARRPKKVAISRVDRWCRRSVDRTDPELLAPARSNSSRRPMTGIFAFDRATRSVKQRELEEPTSGRASSGKKRRRSARPQPRPEPVPRT